MKQESVLNFAALVRIVIVGLIVYLAWKGLTILVMLLIAVLISMALIPIAKKVATRLPWWAAVMVVISLLLIPIVAIIVMTAVVFANQFPQLIGTINHLVNTLPYIPNELRTINIPELIQGNTAYVFNSTKTVINAVGTIATVIAASFYMVYDYESLNYMMLSLFSPERKKILRELISEISFVVGRYIRGNLIISAICTVVILIALTVLGVPFALPLAIFTGIMDLLPYIGPLLALIPAVLLGYIQSPMTGLIVFIVYILYQQIENNIISPFLYKDALNLSPALVFLSVILGAGLFGITGAFLALPVAASVPVLIKYGQKMKKSYTKAK